MVAHGDPPLYFRFARLDALGVPHLTTSRHFPALGPAKAPTPFTADARHLLAEAGLDASRGAWARQVHGAAVVEVGAGGGFMGPADVLVTRARGVPLTIFTADCLAIILCDRQAGVLGLAHAGWRGTSQDVAGATLRALVALGARAERVEGAITPSIGPCCYEVDEPVRRALAAAYPSLWERWLTPRRAGHWALDLWVANREALERAGLGPDRLENPRVCTACHPDLLYSYRRGHRGRLATVAALP